MSVRQMRPLTEMAQQTLPKSHDNTMATLGDLVSARGGPKMAAMQQGKLVDFHAQAQARKNALAVQQQMHGAQVAASRQQAAADSQILAGTTNSVHAEERPLHNEAIARHHAEMRNLVRSLRPEEQALVANASIARRMRGYPEQFYIGSRTTHSVGGWSQATMA